MKIFYFLFYIIKIYYIFPLRWCSASRSSNNNNYDNNKQLEVQIQSTLQHYSALSYVLGKTAPIEVKYATTSRCLPREARMTAVQPTLSAAFTSAPPTPTKYLMQSKCPPPEAKITAVQPYLSAAFTKKYTLLVMLMLKAELVI